MVKPEKIETVQSIKDDYAATVGRGGVLVFTQNNGLTVEQMFKLRRSLREKSAKLRVLKNTLVRRALSESGVTGAADYLKGPTAIAFSPDEVSAPKIIAAFLKELDVLKKKDKLVLKGGIVNGKVVSAREIETLAALPGREEIMGKLLALISTPAVNLLRLIQEPAARVARIIQAAKEKQS